MSDAQFQLHIAVIFFVVLSANTRLLIIDTLFSVTVKGHVCKNMNPYANVGRR